MNFPTLIKKTSPFQILGVLGGFFSFLFKFIRAFCKQTVETPIRHRIIVWSGSAQFAYVPKKDARLTCNGLILNSHRSESVSLLWWYYLVDET